MKKLTNKKGFTLIELVIVVAVLAILAVIAVPAVAGITDKAKESKDAANVALYQSAVERYNIDKNAYPTGKTAVIEAVQIYTNRKSIDKPGVGKIYYVKIGTVRVTKEGVDTDYKAGQIFQSTIAPTPLTINSVVGDWDVLAE